jgi:hypothetical protein
VTQEHVTRTQHNEATTAVDREVHQDHHHTSVQPVQDKEILPEQHTHNVAGVQHKEIHHGDDSHVKDRLAAEQAQFKDTREIGQTQHSSAVAPTVAGEHVHHHVHETIQPVIQKEVCSIHSSLLHPLPRSLVMRLTLGKTVQPSVVHTTIPVHEVHHNEAKHHTASALPAVSMSEFQRQGGTLGGREERTDAFKGEPRSVGSTLGGTGASGTTSLTEKDGKHNHHHANGVSNGTTVGSGVDGTHGNSAGTTGNYNSHGDGKKPSLMDKLNPKKDADGDGKAGLMD